MIYLDPRTKGALIKEHFKVEHRTTAGEKELWELSEGKRYIIMIAK
jgi:hypothetical protein